MQHCSAEVSNERRVTIPETPWTPACIIISTNKQVISLGSRNPENQARIGLWIKLTYINWFNNDTDIFSKNIVLIQCKQLLQLCLFGCKILWLTSR